MKSWFLGLVTDPIFKVTVKHKLPYLTIFRPYLTFQTNGIFHKVTYIKKNEDGLFYILRGHRLSFKKKNVFLSLKIDFV